VLDAHKDQIRATSIYNGAFAELLENPYVMINHKTRQVSCFGSPDQVLDFTTWRDSARFCAAAALDTAAPRYLHCAGSQVSANDLVRISSALTGQPYTLKRAGSLTFMRGLIFTIRNFSALAVGLVGAGLAALGRSQVKGIKQQHKGYLTASGCGLLVLSASALLLPYRVPLPLVRRTEGQVR
jgi:hypothetical protein